jgi:hypothetical protein
LNCYFSSYRTFPYSDIWSCNATGEYGGFISTDTNDYDTSLYNGLIEHLGDTNDGGSVIKDTQTRLRGQQITDDDGIVQFTTLGEPVASVPILSSTYWPSSSAWLVFRPYGSHPYA